MNHIVIRTTEDFENGSHDFRKPDFTPLYGLNWMYSRYRYKASHTHKRKQKNTFLRQRDFYKSVYSSAYCVSYET
jgi:hypothetical protein